MDYLQVGLIEGDLYWVRLFHSFDIDSVRVIELTDLLDLYQLLSFGFKLSYLFALGDCINSYKHCVDKIYLVCIKVITKEKFFLYLVSSPCCRLLTTYTLKELHSYKMAIIFVEVTPFFGHLSLL